MKGLKLFLVAIPVFLMASCKPEKEELSERIAGMESEVLGDSSMLVDRKKALELIGLYEEYAGKFANDTMSAYYLFKAGDYANGTGDYLQAINYYRRCSDAEGFSRREIAFFLQGFIYENQLQDLDNARRIYSAFLEKFPDHPLCGDVRFSLENLGKSPEELIRMFEMRDSLSSPADSSQAG